MRMQYHFVIYKIIRVFWGKWIKSTGRQGNGYGEQFEVGVLTSPFSAVSSRVCAQSRLVMLVEALVSVWVTLNGRWASALMDQWTPVLQGRAWEPESREGSGLWAAFLSTSSYSAEVFSQGAEERGRTLWEEPSVQPEGGLSSLLGGKAAY